MSAGETVLLYNIKDEKKLRTMKMVFLKMGIRIRIITPDLYLQTIGSLIPLKGFEKTDTVFGESGFADEMMVLHGFSSLRLDELLRELYKRHIPKIELKAICTQENISWNSLKLHEELVKEREALNARPT